MMHATLFHRFPSPSAFHLPLCIIIIATVSILAVTSPAQKKRVPRRQQPGTGIEKSIVHDGNKRSYRIHVPKSYDGSKAWPLVFVFHGGSGNANISSRMGFTPAADQRHFIVVYPEALRGHWNDGRTGKKIVEKAGDLDDVGFVRTLLEQLKKDYKIDPNRVFATGASNGGMMSHRVGMELSEHFHAIAPIIGGIAQPLAAKFEAENPVSVLIIQGMADPFVPYAGGPVTPNLFPGLMSNKRLPDHGKIISTDETVALWLRENSITSQAVTKRLPDRDLKDKCRAEQLTWSGGKNGTRVVLIKIAEGGHALPGGESYLPERIIGKVCHDFDAVDSVTEFFGLPRLDKGAK